jgi:hypothetical protein
MAKDAKAKILEAIYADKGQDRQFEISWPTTTAFKHYWGFQRGPIPAAGSYAGAAALARQQITSASSTGGFLAYTDPTAPDKRFLTYGECASGTTSHVGVLRIFDLLVTYRGFDSNTTSNQDPTGGAGAGASDLTRHDGDNCMMVLDVDSASALGATPSNITVTYTNSALASGRVTPATAMTTGAVNSEVPTVRLYLPLQSGDKGVVSVQRVALSAAMGTAGRTFALWIVKPLASINVSISATSGTLYGSVNWIDDALRFKRVLSAAAIGFSWTAHAGATTPASGGTLDTVAVDLSV